VKAVIWFLTILLNNLTFRYSVCKNVP